MKSLTNAVLALVLLAVGFALGWSVRSSYNPVVTVQMGPAERAYFMPPLAQLPVNDPCRRAGEIKGHGGIAPTSLEKQCDEQVAAALNKGMQLLVPHPARK